jgi:hypothetical protein
MTGWARSQETCRLTGHTFDEHFEGVFKKICYRFHKHHELVEIRARIFWWLKQVQDYSYGKYYALGGKMKTSGVHCAQLRFLNLLMLLEVDILSTHCDTWVSSLALCFSPPTPTTLAGCRS